MIREFQDADMDVILALQKANDLPENCLPNLYVQTENGNVESNALFVEKAVMEVAGETVMMSFLKITSEVYLFLDHTKGTPEQRWEWLQEFKEYMRRQAFLHGFEQMTAFVPPDIEESFAKRLKDLGFVKSPWQSYTLNIE